jgi:hypothetical protein
MNAQQFLFGLVMTALLNGCATGTRSTIGEMDPGPSGERVGGQAGLPQEDVALQVFRYREEARAYLQAAQALEEEAKTLEAKSSGSSSVAQAKVALAQHYRQAAEEASTKANERHAQISRGIMQ